MNRSPRILGPDASGHARASHGGEVNGGERQTSAGGDLGRGGAGLEERASPAAQQCPSADSHASAVLHLKAQQMPLIEARKPPLSAEVEPVLGDHRASLAAAA